MKDKLSLKMYDLIARNVIPGAALRVRKSGTVIFDECAGYANVEKQIPVKTDTIYRMCSMTKLITAVGIMQLVERGELSLDDMLLKFFPFFKQDKTTITVRHLLTHSCGIGQGEKSMRYYEERLDERDNLSECIEKWADMPLDFLVGTSAAYNPIIAFDILGRIIEIVSKQDLETYLQANIFVPLDMKDTSFLVTEDRYSRFAQLYSGQDGKLVQVRDGRFSNPIKNRYYSGCGGIYSTLDDYDRFTTMLYYGGQLDGKRIIKEKTLGLMCTPRQITEKEIFPGCPWGLGFMIFEYPEKANRFLGHGTFGWSGAYGTHMYIDTENDLCMTLMAGRMDIGGADSIASHEIEKVIFEELSGQ